MLGLLTQSAAGWALTGAGRGLAEAPVELARERLAERILAHPLVAMARRRASRARGGEAQAALVAELLSACTCLAKSTCERRAQTLMAWVTWAEQQCQAPLALPLFDCVMTPP